MTDSILPPPSLPATAETVLTFLESVGRRSEAEFYLKLFRELPRESFALIALEGSLVRLSGAAIAEELRFLADLGLFAPLVLGLLEPEQAETAAERLLRRLRSAGLEAVLYDLPQRDLAARVRLELKDGQVPILCFRDPKLGESERYAILAELARELMTRKVVVLRHKGSLGASLGRRYELAAGHALQVNADGLSVINLQTDFELLEGLGVLEADDLALLRGLRELLVSNAGGALQANVTAPLALLRELFTVRGAGTLVKRGTPILKADSYVGCDQGRLRGLLESSFSRVLVPDFFEHSLLSVYHEPNYRAAAILEPSTVAPVLSKFAVDPVAQGEGMGRDVWQAFVREHPRIIWRARTHNPICSWYAWQCDGLVRRGKWTVYFRGIAADEIPSVVAEMLGRPEDFV